MNGSSVCECVWAETCTSFPSAPGDWGRGPVNSSLSLCVSALGSYPPKLPCGKALTDVTLTSATFVFKWLTQKVSSRSLYSGNCKSLYILKVIIGWRCWNYVHVLQGGKKINTSSDIALSNRTPTDNKGSYLRLSQLQNGFKWLRLTTIDFKMKATTMTNDSGQCSNYPAAICRRLVFLWGWFVYKVSKQFIFNNLDSSVPPLPTREISSKGSWNNGWNIWLNAQGLDTTWVLII